MTGPIDRDVLEWQPSTRRAWKPSPEKLRHTPGDVVAMYYAAWRVVEVTVVEDVDLDDDERRQMRLWKPGFQERHRPYNVVLQHDRGPVLAHTRRLHDGTRVMHLRLNQGGTLTMLPDRYTVCSCHGDPWPCRDQVRDWAAEREADKLDRLLAQAAPGVCAGCLEPITARQLTLRFPEEHALIPGAPGPVYHAGRGECWWKAGQYEVKHRLPAHPGVDRLASCSGHAYIHVIGGELDCTAGPVCTGLHGPPNARRRNRPHLDGMPNIAADGDCYTRTYMADTVDLSRPVDQQTGLLPRPSRDCGFRHPDHPTVRCLGAVDHEGASHDRA